MTTPGVAPYAWMLCGCFWFSLMGLLAHEAATQCDWRVIALTRSGLAAVIAFAVVKAVGAELVFVRPRVLWVRSLSGTASLLTTFYALTHMPVSDALTITNSFPVWVAVLSWPLVGEKPTAGVWAAVLCAVAGVAVTQQPSSEGFHNGAALSALAASGFTAVAMLGLNRLKGLHPMAVVTHFSTVATVGSGFTFLLFDAPLVDSRPTDPTVLAMLVGVGVTAVLGQAFLTLAFSRGSATKVAVVTLSQVVMVMAAEGALGRSFTSVQLAGTVLVLGPTAWLMTRDRRVPKPVANEPVAEPVAIE